VFWQSRDLFSRSNVQLTAVYALCFGILGTVMSGMGPSLPELGRRTGSSDERMGWVLGVRAFGYFSGSMGGALFDYLPGNMVLVVALVVCSVSCSLVAFIERFWMLILVVPFQGICMGLLDTGGNVMTLWLHTKDPEPYMQALHFCFAIGGLLSPLMIGQIAKHSNGSITVSWVVISLLFIPAILFLLKYESPKEPPRKVTEDGETVHYVGWPLAVLLGTAVFLFFDIGAEAGLATYLVTFIIRRGLSDEPTATVVNTLFWIFMVLGRLIAIPVSTFVRSHTIIISSSVLGIIATGIWLLFYKSFVMLCIAMILYGLGMSVAFATGVLLAQNYIPISGRAGMVFVVGAACGEFIIPISISQLFPATNYMSFPTFLFGCAILCLLLCLFVIWAGERCPKTMEAPPRQELDIVSVDDIGTSGSSSITISNGENGVALSDMENGNGNAVTEQEMVPLEGHAENHSPLHQAQAHHPIPRVYVEG